MTGARGIQSKVRFCCCLDNAGTGNGFQQKHVAHVTESIVLVSTLAVCIECSIHTDKLINDWRGFLQNSCKENSFCEGRSSLIGDLLATNSDYYGIHHTQYVLFKTAATF